MLALPTEGKGQLSKYVSLSHCRNFWKMLTTWPRNWTFMWPPSKADQAASEHFWEHFELLQGCHGGLGVFVIFWVKVKRFYIDFMHWTTLAPRSKLLQSGKFLCKWCIYRSWFVAARRGLSHRMWSILSRRWPCKILGWSSAAIQFSRPHHTSRNKWARDVSNRNLNEEVIYLKECFSYFCWLPLAWYPLSLAWVIQNILRTVATEAWTLRAQMFSSWAQALTALLSGCWPSPSSCCFWPTDGISQLSSPQFHSIPLSRKRYGVLADWGPMVGNCLTLRRLGPSRGNKAHGAARAWSGFWNANWKTARLLNTQNEHSSCQQGENSLYRRRRLLVGLWSLRETEGCIALKLGSKKVSPDWGSRGGRHGAAWYAAWRLDLPRLQQSQLCRQVPWTTAIDDMKHIDLSRVRTCSKCANSKIYWTYVR